LILVENRQKFRFYVEIYERAGALQLSGFKGKPTFERITPHEFQRMAGYVDVSPAGSSPRNNDGLLEHLACPGISAKRRDVPAAPGRSTGALLLEAAADAHADIMIMGGYGHGSWREALLGGVTREILGTSTIPLLLAH